ncbi:SMP-30/gluconolactonase/LRE family protein [Paraglaciecola chathamensis]|uniref:SMP-30/Gluconolactonase/LRE-like region domain-containing protein n=1 Tax=Paraglaciecola agarilytica NO2 TaxID=1125747 RepID=A0ABQ0I362_9ALTE|nr:SMP-30/gluconolactonase/LRE family protein [Paraglaciecola agarilytica]GAC03744.1 hypothetical protein GAGA_0881 [Paraglaciecola agarilytica NO2]
MKKIILAIFVSLLSTSSLAVSAISQNCNAKKVAVCGGFLEGISVSPTGEVWLLDVTGKRILTIENGICIEQGKAKGPNGSKFLPDGTLIIADHGGLLAFNTKTSKLTTLIDTFEAKPLTGLNDLSIDSHGGIYFTVPGSSSLLQAEGRIFYLAPGSKEPKLLSDTIAFPNGIAVSKDESTVLVAEFAAKRIISIPSATVIGGFKLTNVYARTEGGVGPDGILFDDNSRLYAANLATGEVFVYSNGKLVHTINLPKEAGTLVTNLAITKDEILITEAEKGEVWSVPYPLEQCPDNL